MYDEDKDTQEYEEFMCSILHSFACTLWNLRLEVDPDELGYLLCKHWF